jgi:hypothetical protein
LGFVVLIMDARFPLLVRAKDSRELVKFSSVEELQDRVERIDIENDEYEAWDRDGLPVQLKLQEPAQWIKVEPSTENRGADQLRGALHEYAKSVGVELPDQLPASNFHTVLDQIRDEQEAQLLARSPVRRFISRFKQRPGS